MITSKSKDHNNNNCCFSCCEAKQQVQEKVCCDFNATNDNRTIFTSDVNQCENLVVSGTIKNCSSTNNLFVRFFSGNGTILLRIFLIPPGGCFLFTFARMDLIIANSQGAGAIVPGELCITTRYNI